MPLFYVCLHLLAALLCFVAVRRVRQRPALIGALGIAVLAAVVAGLMVERRADWAWRLMPYAGTGLVFCTNLTLEGVATLCALLWSAASRHEEKLRAVLLLVPLLAVSLWSYAWYFAPLPTGIKGQVDARGLLRQTTDDSCSAASAAMLLARYDIVTTEAEMADLCLTRANLGTSPLGLYRGLAIKAAERGLRPHVLRLSQPDQLRDLKQPAIINVGLKADTPWETSVRLESYGWRVGAWHTVLIWRTDKSGQWTDVADPSFGPERWPTEDLKYLWDGSALILVRK
jgi:predicted double-glycine peptidase